MKTTAEQRVGEAVRRLGAYAYKPPDDARNRKPCDFFVWKPLYAPVRYKEGPEIYAVQSTWVEVKMTDAQHSMPYSEIRPAQRAGIAEAMRLGIPYWVVIWWRARDLWTAHLMTNPMSSDLYRMGFFLDEDNAEPRIAVLMERVFTRG